MNEIVRVGGETRPWSKVEAHVKDYLSGTGGWAYPAYPGTPGHEVGKADLLAVCLLNAGQNPIPKYYGLQGLIPAMNKGLAKLPADETFTAASQKTLAGIADLFGILDDTPTPRVGKTKLMKVLHRKRPELIPLFDENIRRCYSEIGEPPVPTMKRRSHRDFAIAWLPALQQDLREQEQTWDRIASYASVVPITPLRALDIVGWWMGKR